MQVEVGLVDATLGMICDITCTHLSNAPLPSTFTYHQLSVSQMHVVSDQVWEENASHDYVLTKYTVNCFVSLLPSHTYMSQSIYIMEESL